MAKMTTQQYIAKLKSIASRRTYYYARWPYNLCYIHKDGRTSADCWNLIKAILNGYDITRQDAGYYQHDLKITGDADGKGLLAKCTDVSNDFTKLKIGEVRYLYLKGTKVDHAGTYLGEIVNIGGKEYNVIECTASWEGKVLYSWVDSDGTRRRFKGGAKNGKWHYHGKMTKWLIYDEVIEEPKPTEPQLIQGEYNMRTIKKGSTGNAVKIWQVIAGTTVDGAFGPNTEKATKNFQRAHGLEVDGIVGPNTWNIGLSSVK